MNFYIIPGYGESRKDYNWLISRVNKKYIVQFLKFDFRKNSFSEMTNVMLEPNSIIFGFSIGALIAYKMKCEVEKGIYCSMSTILGKDSEGKEKYLNELFGKNSTNEFKFLDYGIPNAKDYIIFCGDREMDPSTQKMDNLKIINDAEHEFTDNYKQAIFNYLDI